MSRRGKVRLTLRPGDPGTKRFQEEFEDRLVAVRYRYDKEHGRRFTTVELVVDDRPWTPEIHFNDPDRLVGLRIGFAEEELRERLKRAGARWDPGVKLWWLPLYRVTQLSLEERIALWSKPGGARPN